MAKLEYRFTNDMLFKMCFEKHPELLKMLVSDLLAIDLGSIEQFDVAKTDKLPDYLGDKFSRYPSLRSDTRGLHDNLFQFLGFFPRSLMFLFSRLHSAAWTSAWCWTASGSI